MKFGSVPIAEAVGGTAVHSIRQGDFVLKKGTLIGPAEVAALKTAGVKEITVARLDPGDVSEDQAAADIAAAIAGEGVRIDRAFTGRCNLFAESAGVLVVDRDAVDALNRIDEAVTLATLSAYKPVVEGEMIATVKIIPFAVAKAARSTQAVVRIAAAAAAAHLPAQHSDAVLLQLVDDADHGVQKLAMRSAPAAMSDALRARVNTLRAAFAAAATPAAPQRAGQTMAAKKAKRKKTR